MARRKKAEPSIRVSVTMPRSVYERFERMAAITGSDVNTFVRILASLQLISYEGVYLKKAGDNPSYEQAQEFVRAAVPGLFPELPKVAEFLAAEQESQPEPGPELVTP